MTNPILVEVLRGGLVESVHRGAVCAVDADGATVLALGDVTAPVFPRSAVKALQALPLVESGAADRYRLGEEELAIACGSHGGEPAHVTVAERMLARGPADVPPELAAQRRPEPPTTAELDVAGKADAFLAPLDEASAKDLKQLLALFDNALFSVLTGGPARPFTQMTPEQQHAHLERWATSRLAVRRTGFQALKRLAVAIYYSSPLSYASVGYPGPPYELVRTVNASRRRP